MSIGLVGRKAGMTRVFTDAGDAQPVTVIEALPNRIVQVKDSKADGYRAVQVSFGTRRASRLTKPVAGHYAKPGVLPGEKLVEFRLAEGEGADLKMGAELKVDLFKAGQVVDVTGTSIGKGYAGVMGSGKGNVEYWVAKVTPGKVLFEIEGVPEATAREAFKLAAAKLSVSTAFVRRQVR